MEISTPLSTKRITRSQTKAAALINTTVPMSRNKNEQVPESKQRNGKSDRSALIDITNDSPIVGLAISSSSFSKKMDHLPKMRLMTLTTTPGSGEALLRREVKTLLQKVEEEEAEGGSKLSFDQGHPLFLRFEGGAGVVVDSSSGVRPSESSQVQAEFRIPPQQVVERININGLKEETLESEKSLITRSLLFDFFSTSVETSESSCSSSSSSSSSICSSVGSVSQVQQYSNEEDDDDDDDEGVWSIRVSNIQSKEEEEEEEESEGGRLIDELCEGVMKISVNEKRRRRSFEGKHTRFVYNSEDEIEGEEEDIIVMMRRKQKSSPLHLKGLPTPAGKHLRFSNEEEEEAED